MTERPVSVTIIACAFMAAGVIGLAYHAAEIDLRHPFQFDLVWGAGIRLLAVVGGAFALRRRNWARWLLLIWMAYHVALSAFHALSELLTHVAFFAVTLWFFLRPAASAYFQGATVQSGG